MPEVWKENDNRARGVKEVGKEQQNAMGGVLTEDRCHLSPIFERYPATVWVWRMAHNVPRVEGYRKSQVSKEDAETRTR